MPDFQRRRVSYLHLANALCDFASPFSIFRRKHVRITLCICIIDVFHLSDDIGTTIFVALTLHVVIAWVLAFGLPSSLRVAKGREACSAFFLERPQLRQICSYAPSFCAGGDFLGFCSREDTHLLKLACTSVQEGKDRIWLVGRVDTGDGLR